MSDNPFAVVEALARKERQSREARDALGLVLSQGIINPTLASGLFNGILLRLELVEDATQETAATDGRKLVYNPEFICSLSPEQQRFLLNHEALHVGLAHPARMCGCDDLESGNIAADLVVNHILRQSGLAQAPPGGLFPGEGAWQDITPGLDFETTYEQVRRKKQEQQPNPDNPQEPPDTEDQDGRTDDDADGAGDAGAGDQRDDRGGAGADPDGDEEEGPAPEDAPAGDGRPAEPGSAGGGEPAGGGAGSGGSTPCPDPGRCGGVMRAGDGSPAAAATQQAEAEIMLAEGEAAAARIGTLPAALRKLLEARKRRPQDWRARLREWLTRRSHDRLGWDRPRSWGISRGIYLPGKSGKSLGKLIVAIDTSGSCWGEPLRQFAAELESVVEQFPNSRLWLVYCDCRVNLVQEWDPSEGLPLVLEAVGGGGTSHLPVFEWIEEHEPDAAAVLCFTDLMTAFPDQRPPQDVLWAVPGPYADYQPPFGEVIRLETQP